MNRIVLKSRVDGTGVLHVDVPVGRASAGQEVQVTVEPVTTPLQLQSDWQQAILATAGKWQGDFIRPDQGQLEAREPLP